MKHYYLRQNLIDNTIPCLWKKGLAAFSEQQAQNEGTLMA